MRRLFVLLAAAYTLPAQTGRVAGFIRDASGAVITSASVKLTDTHRNSVRLSESNSAGSYVFANVLPGVYSVAVTASGFQATLRGPFQLEVNQTVTLDFELAVRTSNETIQVTAAPPLLQTEGAAVGTVINREFLENLPLNGRSLQSLFLLTPGVVPSSSTTQRLGQFSVNGQRESSNMLIIDGAAANVGIAVNVNAFGDSGQYPGFNAQGGTNSLIPVDALEEFQIQTSSFAPEFGRTPGGQISLVTRSGTNRFRGSLFDYFRNEKLDANDWFANRSSIKRVPLRMNQFGGTFGGPLAKDRTFFFANYEGLRLLIPVTAIRQVPSLAARELAQGQMRDLLRALPLPTGRELGNGLAEFTAAYSDRSENDTGGIRVDHSFTQSLKAFGRFSQSASRSLTRQTANAAGLNRLSFDLRSVSSGLTWTPSPVWLNDLRFNYTENRGGSRFFVDTFGGAVPPPESIFFPNATNGDESQTVFFFTSANDPNVNIGSRSANAQHQIQISDTVSLSVGSHLFRGGFDYRRLAPTLAFGRLVTNYFFDTVGAAIAGQTNRVSLAGFNGPAYPLFTNYSAFIQDTWRVTPRLTVTYGLRWDVNPGPTERKGGKHLGIVTGLDDPATFALKEIGNRPFATQYGNVAPRLGVAWRTRGTGSWGFVLRGGIGWFYDISTGQLATAYDAFRYPLASALVLTAARFPLTSSQYAIPPLDPNPPYRSMMAFQPDLKSPRITQWNVTWEQGLGASQSASAGYIGSRGRRMYRTESWVNPNPIFQDLDVVRNAGEADYHSLQLHFQRRLARSVQALASYTWSHSIDTESSDLVTGSLPLTIHPARNDRASSDFDRRHVFTAAITYQLPAPASPVLARIVRGWAIDAAARALSAAPINLRGNFSRAGSTNLVSIRPDVIPGAALYLTDASEPSGERLNPAAFRVPTPLGTRQGNLGRNALRGQSLGQVDIAIRRQFSFGERLGLQLRFEMFNAFNHPSFADPINNVNSATFGRITQMSNRGLGGLNPLFQIGGPRSIQLGAKINF